MPALLAYLIAVTLLLGGGYGALSWLATPEPVKVVAKAAPKPAPRRYVDNSKPDSGENPPARGNPPESSKPEISETDQVKATANDSTVSSDPPPSDALSPRPEPPVALSQQEAKAEVSDPPRDQRDRPAQVEKKPRAVPEQTAKRQAEAPPVEARQDDSASARHEEEKQPVQAVQPGSAHAAAAIAPAAKRAKRARARQASRGFERRPLEVMTLRTIELPDGRRMTQLIPHRGGDRYRDDGAAMAFGPDE